MAKYMVTHRCGHEVSHNLFGPGKERKSKLMWLAAQECQECYIQKQVAEAMKKSEEMGLPELIGSEKQIAWAVQIRVQKLRELDALKSRIQPGSEGEAKFAETIEILLRNVGSRFWIENRDSSGIEIIRPIAMEIASRINQKEETK